jgi:soluble lytic murein transglycosylase-like protein
LVAKLINRESSFRVNAHSGPCVGLMQVDRRYYFRPRENPVDVHTNLRAGCRELAACHKAFPEWERALTAYNAGKGAVARRGTRTSKYARQVLAGQ